MSYYSYLLTRDTHFRLSFFCKRQKILINVLKTASCVFTVIKTRPSILLKISAFYTNPFIN